MVGRSRGTSRARRTDTVSKIIQAFSLAAWYSIKGSSLRATSIQRYYRGHVYIRAGDFLLTNRMRRSPLCKFKRAFAVSRLGKSSLGDGSRAAGCRDASLRSGEATYCRRRSKNTLVLDSAYGPRSYAGGSKTCSKYSSAGHAGGATRRGEEPHAGDRFREVLQGYSGRNWEENVRE